MSHADDKKENQGDFLITVRKQPVGGRLGSTRTHAANTLRGWDLREGFHRSFSTNIPRNLFTWISFIASKDQNANDGITAAKAAFVSTKPSPPDNSHKLYPSSSFFVFYSLGNFYYTCCRGKEVRILGIFQKYFPVFLMTRIAYQRLEPTLSYNWTCVGHGFFNTP